MSSDASRRHSTGSSSSTSSSSSSASGSWRSSNAPWRRGNSLPAAPTTSLPLPTPSKPSFDDVQEGMVFFLPEPPKSSRMQVAIDGTDQDPWGHPFVVTGKRVLDGDDCVEVRCCTSFAGRRITETHKPTHQHDLFVLADNNMDSVPHGTTSLAGVIAGSAKFPKRTYVNLSKASIYEVEYQYLTACKYGQIQFDLDAILRIKAGRSS
ncbi:hypothetical protein FB567DRAFT_586114 [Paraphoma chrysanthemicola]|uniref:Uncharacterized protein n=1 Tax=Paraphoma chrysanthemicola TaxID=798071 RepID=A0A8K0RHU6_9PLEO|nr:hypothetical protein FB567DRAFT_586114 [Paraphoma chrysanthemicola]